MPDEAARLLAAALHERGEDAAAAATARCRVPACWPPRRPGCAARTLSVDKQTRLWEATAVAVPPAPAGSLRRATESDADRSSSTGSPRFHAEADEQAGREPDHEGGEHNTLDSVLVRIREGVEWLWELPGGRWPTSAVRACRRTASPGSDPSTPRGSTGAAASRRTSWAS